MAGFDLEVEGVQAAIRNVEQIKKDIKAVGSKLRANPGGARALIRPCALLVERLIETQASIEELIEQLTHAEAA